MDKDKIAGHFRGRWADFYDPLIPGKLKPVGRDSELQGLCPLHDDSNPSLSVNQETGLWKCFECNQGGDCFDFWAKLKGLSTVCNFQEILAGIAKYYGIDGDKQEQTNGNLGREQRRRRKAEKQRALMPGFVLTPTKTRGWRGKPPAGWREETYADPTRDERGHSVEGYITVNVPLQGGVAAVYQTKLDLNGCLEGKEIAAKLDLSARTLGWNVFDEKMFDVSVLFADRHPERSGAFVYDPADFGKLLFPGRERLGKQDYTRMHLSMTKFTEQRYNFTLPDQCELKDFRIIADYGRIIKKSITISRGRNRQKESVEVYVGGLFQIFGGIWEDIKKCHQLAPIEIKALGLPDRLYPINRAIKFCARINWKNKRLRETKVCRMGLRTLIEWANISISPNHEKREIERLHGQLDELVKERMFARWWIQGARGGGETPKTWYKKTRLVEKKVDNMGGAVYRTRWERMDKIYCFLLTNEYISFCFSGIQKLPSNTKKFV